MPAIRVAQAARSIIIFGEEQRGVGALDRVLEKELVHRFQESLRMFQCDGTLAAQIRLEIGHQESRGDAFACNVAHHQPQALLAEIQKIVVITADMAGLNANARIIERATGWLSLREEPRLHHARDFQFLGCAALGFQLPGDGAALFVQRAADLIESDERKRIPVDIFESA